MQKVCPTDLLFHAYREAYKLSEQEFDSILEKASDEEIDALFIDRSSTFSQKKLALSIVNKYLG